MFKTIAEINYLRMMLNLNKDIVESTTFNEILRGVVRMNPSLNKVSIGNLKIGMVPNICKKRQSRTRNPQ